MVRARAIASFWKNRRLAVFLCYAIVAGSFAGLAGCQIAYNNNPLLDTVGALTPGAGSVSAQAEQIPYASLRFTLGGRGGLLVLAELAGSSSFWQSGRRETIVLRDGYLASMHGMSGALRMTDIEGSAGPDSRLPWRQLARNAVEYRVIRSWETPDGALRTDVAQASFECSGDLERVQLPLLTKELQRCSERLVWSDGGQTSSVYWRSPDDRRIWAAEVMPWPNAPAVSWQVARRWW